MNRTPVADWQQLSALYEAADALDPIALAAWLAQLRAQPHPLLEQLEQMLAARAQVQHNGFLGTLPRLPLPPEPPVVVWAEGSRIGHYRLLRHLGEGGMAEVWMAQRDDGAFQRTVAIKLLFRNAGSTQRDSFAQRFARERDILASLDHPHIAGLHDAGVTPNGQPWLALEYVEGQTLTRWCDTQRLSIEARVRLFRQVLLAVQHAHANLVIHRDLKPGNILVTTQGEVRLLDFGIAKLMEPDGGALAETELTKMAGRPMTPNYAAPEQLLGQPLTTACDVYALGVVLYELLCGERPYELKLASAAQLEQSILEVEPRGPSRRALTEAAVEARGTTSVALRKTLSSDLDAIVLRALAKQPAKRYGSAEALRVDLDRWLAGEPVEARVPSAAYRVSKFIGRHRWATALGAGAVLSLIGVTVVAVAMGLQAREDSARAGAARDFMLNLFARANQEKSRGADITARDLLETGRKDVLTRLAGQPKLQAELLKGIAKIQSDMGEYATADGTYGNLARLYMALHEPREAAFTLADHAENATLMGNPALAARRLDEAKAIRGGPADDAELAARFDGVQGWIALSLGQAASARTMLMASYRHAKSVLGETHLQTFRLGLALFRAERDLLNVDQALALHQALRRTAGEVVGLSATESTGLDTNLVELLYRAGRFAQALKTAEVATPECIALHGAENQYCRQLQIKRWQTLQRLGFVDRALADDARIVAVADDSTAPVNQVNALLLAFRLRSAAGHTVGLDALRQRVETFAESGPEVAVRPVFKVAALLTLAETSLRDENPEQAQRWLDAATSRLAKGSQPHRPDVFDAVRGALQGIAYIQRDESERGLRALQASQLTFAAAVGAEHPLTRLCALNSAIALARLGRLAEAQALVEANDAPLRDALGEDAPIYIKVAQLRRSLEAPPDGRFASSPRRGVPGPVGRVATFEFFS